MQRVVITGIGMVSPTGFDKREFWNNLVNGKSGITAVENFDVSKYPCQIAGEIKNFDPTLFTEKKETQRVDRFTHFGVAAAMRAWEDAGLKETAGAIEMIATLLIMKHQVIHPTINYEYPDPDCDLDYVPNKSRRAKVDIALSNSFGFGGTNATLIDKKYLP